MKKFLYSMAMGMCLVTLMPIEAALSQKRPAPAARKATPSRKPAQKKSSSFFDSVKSGLRDAKKAVKSAAIEVREAYDNLDEESKQAIRNGAANVAVTVQQGVIDVAKAKNREERRLALEKAGDNLAAVAKEQAETVVINVIASELDAFTRPEEEDAIIDVTTKAIEAASNQSLPAIDRVKSGIEAGMLAIEHKPELTANPEAEKIAMVAIEMAATNVANDGKKISGAMLQKEVEKAAEDMSAVD